VEGEDVEEEAAAVDDLDFSSSSRALMAGRQLVVGDEDVKPVSPRGRPALRLA